MASILIGIHAFLGELAIISFLWSFIEILNPTTQRLKRAKVAALLGTILLFISWFSGGFYYTTIYGSEVKPLIKEGITPWAHLIFMEVKEHVFLFLPFLGILSAFVINLTDLKNKKYKLSALFLLGTIVFIGFLMGVMGYLISSAARTALGG